MFYISEMQNLETNISKLVICIYSVLKDLETNTSKLVYIYIYIYIHQFTNIYIIVQELCESRGGRPNEPSGFRGCKAILKHASALVSACP